MFADEILLLQSERHGCSWTVSPVEDMVVWKWRRSPVAAGEVAELQLAESRSHVLIVIQQQGQ